EAKFTGRVDFPGNIFASINPVRSENPVRKDEWRRAHARNSNSLTPEILDFVNWAVHAGLDAQTSGVNSAEKSYVEALLDWFQEIHHQMVRDVVGAEGKVILIIWPTAFHQFRLEAFILKESPLVSDVNWRFAGQTNEPDLHMLRIDDFGRGFLAAAGQKQAADTEREDEFRGCHFYVGLRRGQYNNKTYLWKRNFVKFSCRPLSKRRQESCPNTSRVPTTFVKTGSSLFSLTANPFGKHQMSWFGRTPPAPIFQLTTRA